MLNHIPNKLVKIIDSRNPRSDRLIIKLRKRRQRAYKKATTTNKDKDWAKYNKTCAYLNSRINKIRHKQEMTRIKKLKSEETRNGGR